MSVKSRLASVTDIAHGIHDFHPRRQLFEQLARLSIVGEIFGFCTGLVGEVKIGLIEDVLLYRGTCGIAAGTVTGNYDRLLPVAGVSFGQRNWALPSTHLYNRCGFATKFSVGTTL